MEFRNIILIGFSSLLLSSCASGPAQFTYDNCYGYDSRSAECIQTVFKKNKNKINTVYKNKLTQSPELRGKILFNIHLDNRGKVAAVIIKNNEIKSKALVVELVKVIKTFNFFEGNEYSFHYPLDLMDYDAAKDGSVIEEIQ